MPTVGFASIRAIRVLTALQAAWGTLYRPQDFRSSRSRLLELLPSRVELQIVRVIDEPAFALYAITHTYQLGGEGSWDYVIMPGSFTLLVIERQGSK